MFCADREFESMPCCGVDELKTGRFWMAMLAEFIGTFLLVLVACGSCPEAIHNLPNGFSIIVPNRFSSSLLYITVSLFS